MLAVLIVHRDLCAIYADRPGVPFRQLLDHDLSGAGSLRRRLVD
jgi:hypothetical protein